MNNLSFFRSPTPRATQTPPPTTHADATAMSPLAAPQATPAVATRQPTLGTPTPAVATRQPTPETPTAATRQGTATPTRIDLLFQALVNDNADGFSPPSPKVKVFPDPRSPAHRRSPTQPR